MAEDYTYTTVTDWRKRAHELAGNVLDLESAAKKQRERVQELEHQLAQADSNTVALAARNAELAARLDAVPVEVIKLWFEHHFGAWERYWPDWVRPLGVWLRDTAGFATNKEGM